MAAPLREQVLSLIRQAILDFKLPPGHRLIERELVEEIGVSRTTVREVLARLASEGFVTMVPQKGAIVTVLSVDEAADIYEMRASLEALAVQRFIERASPDHVRGLREAYTAFQQIAEAAIGSSEELRAKDRFYEVLLEGAGSPPLSQILSTLQGRVRVLRATSLSAAGRAQTSAAEIRTVVEAIEAGNASLAAEACVTHVRNAARAALTRLAGLSSSDEPASLSPRDIPPVRTAADERHPDH